MHVCTCMYASVCVMILDMGIGDGKEGRNLKRGERREEVNVAKRTTCRGGRPSKWETVEGEDEYIIYMAYL